MEPWTQSKDYQGQETSSPQGPNPMNVANGRLLINLLLGSRFGDCTRNLIEIFWILFPEKLEIPILEFCSFFHRVLINFIKDNKSFITLLSRFRFSQQELWQEQNQETQIPMEVNM